MTEWINECLGTLLTGESPYVHAVPLLLASESQLRHGWALKTFFPVAWVYSHKLSFSSTPFGARQYVSWVDQLIVPTTPLRLEKATCLAQGRIANGQWSWGSVCLPSSLGTFFLSLPLNRERRTCSTLPLSWSLLGSLSFVRKSFWKMPRLLAFSSWSIQGAPKQARLYHLWTLDTHGLAH